MTPPASSDKQPAATEALFAVLHTLDNQQSLISRSNKPATVFSLETVATRGGGIRYIVRLPASAEALFRHTIVSYLPELRLQKVTDELAGLDLASAQVTEFNQSRHFAYPLKRHDLLDVHDPLSYLTGAMTKLGEHELMVFQIVLSSANIREIGAIRLKIMRNENILDDLNKSRFSFLSGMVSGLNKLSFASTDLVTSTVHGASKESYMSSQRDAYQKHQAQLGLKPARTLTMFEQELVESIHNKLNQSMFRADIRVLVLSDSKQQAVWRRQNIESALAAFSMPEYQALKARGNSIFSTKKRRLEYFTKRLPSTFKRRSSLLAVSEVADLYHFPSEQTHKTENIVKSLSRELPAPVSLKNGSKLEVLLGVNHFHGSSTAIGLTEAERERHTYVIGGTGSGKTTMLQYAIVQDIKNGKGVAVVDPHGDLAETIIRHIPKERLKDVVYFNPDDLDYPIGLNLLEVKPGLTGNDLLREQARITEAVVSVFRKIFSDEDTGGHRIEYVLRNTIETAMTVKDATLFTVLKLLQSATYRNKIIDGLTNEDLKDFWRSELGQAGNMQRVKMSAGITAKIGRFRSSPSARFVLQQTKSTIDFDDIINSGKILICNFAKGALGEDTSQLFGIATLAMLQLAAYHRVHIDKEARRPYFLYVDEFQNFATPSFVQMLSESRKYKLLMTMAEQSTSQQKDQQTVGIILANVGTVVCFRTGNPQDEKLLLPLFTPHINENEINNQSAYNFYARLSAVTAQEPVSGQTVLLSDKGSDDIAREVIKLSRQAYGRPVKESVPAEQTIAAAEDQVTVTADKTDDNKTETNSVKEVSSKGKKVGPKTGMEHDEYPEKSKTKVIKHH
ncbi:MAG TPA: type IV secretory system conjugative DNA transfer family protein [Patescibacteria group bacterium]|nr:type IV secretory system conjugative DNA transfer family protein [Patescibacteria group bacterium]